MSHVEGHPRDRFRDFIEYMVQDAPVGGAIPSSVEGVKVKDVAGRAIRRGALPLTIGSGGLSLLMLGLMGADRGKAARGASSAMQETRRPKDLQKSLEELFK